MVFYYRFTRVQHIKIYKNSTFYKKSYKGIKKTQIISSKRLVMFFFSVPCSFKKCSDTETTQTSNQTTPSSICPEGWTSGVDYCFKNITSYPSNYKSLVGINNDLVAITFEKTVKILNVSTGQELRTLIGHTENVNTLAMLRTGDLASGSEDNTIKIWNVYNGTELNSFGGHSSSISHLVVLADGSLASCGHFDSEIKIWSPYESRLNRSINTNDSDVTVLAVLSDTHIASGSKTGIIRLINTTNGQEIKILTGHTGPILSLLNLPNQYFVSGSNDKTMKVWNKNDGLYIMTLTGHSFGVNVLALLQGLYLISSGSFESSIKLWSINDGSYLCEVTEGINGVDVITVLDNNLIVFGLHDGSIFIGYLLS